MVAFQKTGTERREGHFKKRFSGELKDLIKDPLGRLMLEEREFYLEQHPIKGNGYYTYTRDLLTLFGPLRCPVSEWC